MSLDKRFESLSVKVVRNEQYLSAAHSLLDRCKQGIDICTYKFEFSKRADARGLNFLIDKICALAKSGREIRILLDTTRKQSGLTKINEYAGRRLRQCGIKTRTLPDRRCQHAKLLIVDSSFALIGSHNWSPKSMTENFEVSVLIQDVDLLKDIQAHFAKIWEAAIPI